MSLTVIRVFDLQFYCLVKKNNFAMFPYIRADFRIFEKKSVSIFSHGRRSKDFRIKSIMHFKDRTIEF